MAGIHISAVVALLAACIVGQASAQWGPWSSWGDCDCDGDQRQDRYRTCINPTSTLCTGTAVDSRDCEDDCIFLTDAAIAGIVVGAVVFLFLIIILIVICCWCGGCMGGCYGCPGGQWGGQYGDDGHDHGRTVVIQAPPQQAPVYQPPAPPQTVQIVAKPQQYSFAPAAPTVGLQTVQVAQRPVVQGGFYQV